MVEAQAAADDIGATVERAVSGDAAALARIVARYHDDMARVCMVVCGDADIAEDAVQAAWPIAWQRLRTLRQSDRLRPWLISIAVNQARQIRRRERRRQVLEIASATSPRDRSGSGDRIELADLSLALRRLPPDDRALLALRFVAGFDSHEIAQSLGISASGVRSRLERLLARLRTELSDD